MKRLTIGLGIAVIIFILLCTVACGGGDGALAEGGINMIVVSGKARIQADEGDTSVVEGQEVVITAGDQIMAGEAGVTLLLADGSSLYLSPDTDLQVVTFSAEGMARLRSQLKGRLEVETASPLLTVEVSTSVIEPFAVKTIQFTATPTARDTTFRLWIDDVNHAHLTVEAGEVNVTHNDRTATISAGGEVKVVPGEGLIVSQTGATAGLTSTATPTATRLFQPSPIATATPTPLDFLYRAPGLSGPGNGSNFKPSDDILLMWDTSTTTLSQDEWYEVQLWREEEPPKVVQWVKEGTWKVEREYYPGRYQWRIRIVRGQGGRKEGDLSPPSQTWSFSWLRPPPTQTPAAPTSSPSNVPVDLTVYMRGTNNEEDFVALRGQDIDAGTIYAEGGTVYGDVAVRIGETLYHFDQDPEPVGVEQLPAPYRLEFEFSNSLIAATDGKPGSDPQKAQFWVGTLNYHSATPPDKPYRIEMTLYAGGEARKHIEVSFHVADSPSPVGPSEGPKPRPTRP
jgi:hypothetical protein